MHHIKQHETPQLNASYKTTFHVHNLLHQIQCTCTKRLGTNLPHENRTITGCTVRMHKTICMESQNILRNTNTKFFDRTTHSKSKFWGRILTLTFLDFLDPRTQPRYACHTSVTQTLYSILSYDTP